MKIVVALRKEKARMEKQIEALGEAISVLGRSRHYLVGAKRWRPRRDLNSEPNGSKPFALSN